jgi:4a-hydroxytetrahydrobiopterin dehydratase
LNSAKIYPVQIYKPIKSGELLMTERLSSTELDRKLADLEGWTLEDNEIRRTFTLDTFPKALLFVAAVGHLAETAGHHPDILIKYRNVKLSLTTHDAGGLTEKDFTLAAKINQLVS